MMESKEDKKSSATSHSHLTRPEFELIVEGDNGGAAYDSEDNLQTAADCIRMMEGVRDEADLTEIMEKFRRKTEKGEMTGLSSTATTVSSSMASQWINHMKRSFKRHAIALSEEQQGVLKKMVNEHGSTDLAIRDILMLYSRGLEAHHDGCYREMFHRIRPCIPYFNTNVLVWIRVSEALIYEFYEEVWEFKDSYKRLFAGCDRRYVASLRRRCNELKARHPDMNLRFAETATLMTFALAKHSSREPVHYAAATLHGFLLLKLKKYTEAIETVNFILMKYDKTGECVDSLTLLLTYKAEGMIGIGRYNRAIEYCLRVVATTTTVRAKHRALMLITMAYMRKNNFKKAHEYVILLLSDGQLDENMLENVALLGLNLAHLMGNMELFKRFEKMLQRIVY
ncbi:hypothetical protein GCK72_002372 [Caenorhabditis remanei]|uniref:Uncharacterized protein n=1 Tax=Caenorhabditis remanei TaxID=31234 RepID=A0A2P4V949_CAERE|nr:hypothetical protein GCK72_002372 [Caenorhabditis remanei]KAF1770553.1 hypothetical protein GCK72_002372 [Caenorhabditis remanei]